ncbi:hypothetical protein CMUS01_04964 [Colletotrichum musicola]|uniref:Uncharacterized protein n=1 Tax=Colletotrichum musicola TaxID=2175873 RepID=A0A8H6KTT2_9PEZI|nr:hypothetical protein CMUS01_04964 [Colletotrichum musicola]
MAPLPYPPDATMHQLARRDAEQGRIAGMLVGCLIGGLVAVGLVYYCVNCVFGREPRKKGGEQQQGHHHHGHAQPRQHRCTLRADHGPHERTHARAHNHANHPHTHRWTHHRHTHRHHPKRKTKPKRSTKTKKRKSARRGRGGDRSRGTTVQFMPMPPMDMPAPVAGAAGMGIGMGMGFGVNDGFIDYVPPLGMENPMQGVAWGVDPDFRLEQFADPDDPDGDREVGCNECCFAFWDALCGVEPGSRNLERDIGLDGGPVVLGEEEMAAV